MLRFMEGLANMATTTFIKAAYLILKRSKAPLDATEITLLAEKRGLISTSGKTPSATMRSKLSLEVKKDESKFVKIKRGIFGLKEWDS